MTDNQLKKLFEDKIWSSYKEAKDRFNYTDHIFTEMLHNYGAIQTSIKLIMNPVTSGGLAKMVLYKAINLTVEATVLEGPWKRLFNEDVLSMARKKLANYEYTPIEYEGDETSFYADVENINVDKINYESTASKEELEERVNRLMNSEQSDTPEGVHLPRNVETSIVTFYRDPAVKAWVLKNAAGACECCNKPAPFKKNNGYPFLEVHHVIELSNEGSDKITNAVALCPNCHRACHYSDKKNSIIKDLYNTIDRLEGGSA